MDAHELTQKWHGLPMYAWIGGGGLLLGGVVIYIRKRAGTGATPAAAVADNTPSAADNGAVDTASMPWSGGAPISDGSVDALSAVVGNLSDQQQSNAESTAAAIQAAIAQEAQDNIASQNAITSMAAENAKNASTFSDSYASLVAETNAAVAKATAAAPAPTQANTPSTQAQPGIGYHVSSYLPTKTVAAASKKGVVHAA